MTEELKRNFEALEKDIFDLSAVYEDLKLRYLELSDECLKMKAKYAQEHEKNKELEEEKKSTALLSAFSGRSPQYNRLAKHQINRLIKEIDACIVELQSVGL